MVLHPGRQRPGATPITAKGLVCPLYRIVVFAPKENIFAYMLERFDMKTHSWVFCYESAKGFGILSDLYEELDSSFEDVILED